ncbi:MAG TPA: tetratricopeptide repeat protein [Candidatus Krumholzibacteria bacterium]|nr:tetratricopeptide repeat protein [Candidatus Krumholzibacteria bacterium]
MTTYESHPAAQAAFSRGRDLEAAGDLAGAEHAYREALDQAPDLPEGSYRLGCVLRKAGRIEEAATAFRAAAAADPDAAKAWTNLGASLEDLGRREEAADMYGRATAATGDVRQAWTNLGAIHADAGRRPEAQRCFEAALALGADVEGYTNLGLLHFHGGDYEAALTCFDKGAALAPDSALAHYYAGLALLKKGVPKDALNRFRKAQRLDERLVRCHAHIGTCLHKLQDFDGALASLRRALDHLPDDGRVHYQMALTLTALELHQEARRHYRLARGEAS